MGLKAIKAKLGFLKYLDPFHYVDLFLMPVLNPDENELISWVVYIVSAFVFALAIYSILGFVLGTSSPMVIVVSGSMEPVYYRGDVIVLQGTTPATLVAPEVDIDTRTLQNTYLNDVANTDYVSKKIIFKNGTEIPFNTTNDIVVYFSNLRQQPIIHRVMAKLNAGDGTYVVTKGDNNNVIDQECTISSKQCISLFPVPVSELDGKALLKIPFVGCVKLWLFDNLGSVIITGNLPENYRGIC
ncbi:MAG: hypothetical protein V1672_03815 [Candidatus Diapherotrites archaeon]